MKIKFRERNIEREKEQYQKYSWLRRKAGGEMLGSREEGEGKEERREDRKEDINSK